MTRLTRQILVLTLGLGFLSEAFAQTTTTTTSTAGTGTCSGTVNGKTISGKTMLSLGSEPVQLNVGPAGEQSVGCSGASDSIDIVQQNLGTAFGLAECQCQGRGLKMRVVLDSPVAQDGQAFNASMYVGPDNCSDQTERTRSGTTCEQVTSSNPANNWTFKLDANSFRSVAPIDVSLPAELLTKRQGGMPCDTQGPQNVTAQVLLGPDASPATCKLALMVDTQGPAAPSLNEVGGGNGALTAHWSVAEGTAGILFYQLLCRKKSDPTKPVMSEAFLAETRHYFSACIDGVLYRRPYNASNTNSIEEHKELAVPPEPGKFLVDPHFICSDRIVATTTDLSQRISGLENGEAYEVMVVAIDAYGNAKPSNVVVGTPMATKGVFDDACQSESNCPTGFGCSSSGRKGSGSVPFAAGALILAWGLARRRRTRS